VREPGAIVIADPATELLTLVQRSSESSSASDDANAALLRRRFGLALPPPFTGPIDAGDPEASPVRLAVPADGPAIASVKWRAFGDCYRGVLPDEFLDGREIVPPVAFWIGRAAVPPSRRHSLFVLGRPGLVLGYCDAGPCRDSDVDAAVTGEVYELYLDPTALRAGGGRRLLDRTVAHLVSSGSTDLRLWVLRANEAGRAFYEACGWRPDGTTRIEDLGMFEFEEVRYRADSRLVGGDF
jgi:ribosomal protein S18 acetylase RimI-like enzyme